MSLVRKTATGKRAGSLSYVLSDATVDLIGETTSQLYACNYDPRCASLPPPPPMLAR